jgi:hypothetical protein
MLRQQQPDFYARLRLHFFGTSNQTNSGVPQRVVPVAREFGIEDRVTEIAPRIDYLEALTVLTQATAILMMGSTEPHYTASKLYPGLLAQRPILAVFHESSSVVDILRRAARPPAVRIVTYNDIERAEGRSSGVMTELAALLANLRYDAIPVDNVVMKKFSSGILANKLAVVLERVRRA